MTRFERHTFARDLRASLALSDARKAELAAARARARGNSELRSVLEAAAKRRGEAGIGWDEYFRNVGLNA